MMGALHVVQLEFDGLAAEERFDRLRAALPPVPVHPVDPIFLNTAADAFTCLALRADRLARKLTLPARAAVIIQACGTGTSLALAAAARLEQDGHEVRLVQLFNPEAVTRGHLETAYCELANRLGASPTQSRRLARDVLGGRDCAQGKLLALRAALCEAGERFARGLGVPEPDAPTFSLELVNRYSAWLNFLLSSLGTRYPPVRSVLVYQTRHSPVVDDLRAAALDLRVRDFDGGLTGPGLLASAVADVNARGDGHGKAATALPAGRGDRLASAGSRAASPSGTTVREPMRAW